MVHFAPTWWLRVNTYSHLFPWRVLCTVRNPSLEAYRQHADFACLLKDACSKIRKEYNAEPPSGIPLNHDWPGDKILLALVDIAVPLFIVAATVYRFVDDPHWNPQEWLETILRFPEIGKLELRDVGVLVGVPRNIAQIDSNDCRD
jgi:hypothetical protein